MNRITRMLSVAGLGIVAGVTLGGGPAMAATGADAGPSRAAAAGRGADGHRVVGFYRSYRSCAIAGSVGERMGRWDDFDCERTGFRSWVLEAGWDRDWHWSDRDGGDGGPWFDRGDRDGGDRGGRDGGDRDDRGGRDDRGDGDNQGDGDDRRDGADDKRDGRDDKCADAGDDKRDHVGPDVRGDKPVDAGADVRGDKPADAGADVRGDKPVDVCADVRDDRRDGGDDRRSGSGT